MAPLPTCSALVFLCTILSQIGGAQPLFQFSCSLDAAGDRLALPALNITHQEIAEPANTNTFVPSNPDVVYVFPVPSVNCEGTVSAVRHCYGTEVDRIGVPQLAFHLLILEQNDLNFNITDNIFVDSIPRNEICTRRPSGVLICCDTFSLSEVDQFSLPPANFAFGIVRTASTVDLLTYNIQSDRSTEFLVEHFRPAVADFPPLHVGSIYTSEGSPRSDGVPLRLLQFLIGNATFGTTSSNIASTTVGDATTDVAVNTTTAGVGGGGGSAVGPAIGGVVVVGIVVAVAIVVVIVVVMMLRRRRTKEPQRQAGEPGIDNAIYGSDRHNEETKNDYAGTGPHAYSEIDKSDQFPTAYEIPEDGAAHPYGLVGTNGVDNNVYEAIVTSSMEPAYYAGVEEDIYMAPGEDENTLYQQLHDILTDDIARQAVILGAKLGSGQFGTVYNGVLQSPSRGDVDVAVKTLKEGSGEEDRVKFLQEAAIMGQFKHPNVVTMYGVVTLGEPILLVLELLSKGDLRDHLLHAKSDGGVVSVDAQTLLGYCRQVASGMTYLSSKAFVHRDLAARNILISDDNICKIADFGMSRDLVDESYYVSHGGKIPVKWTAPEALYYKKYSTASDVWSYGALMYEIWSVGHKPFQNFTNNKVLKLVETGYRLPPPPGCPRAIYAIMMSCWHPQSSKRPQFGDLSQQFSLPNDEMLKWTEEDKSTHPEVDKLGADLLFAEDLHKDLQVIYKRT